MSTKSQNKKNFMLLLHSAMVFGISHLIASCFILSTGSLSFFGVLGESDDVPMTDIYLYINVKTNPAKLDTTITFVDIDLCKDRLEIAQLIAQIDSLQPRAIGLDILFRNRKDPEADSILESVIRQCNNLVLACILDSEQQGDKYYACSRNFFTGQDEYNFIEGFINLDSDGFTTVQTFTSKLFLQQEKSLDTLYSFAAQIVRLCDETAFQKLLQRHGNLEIIHFQPLRFYEIDKNEIEDNRELITGKTVFIGSFSEDLHKTPINSQMRGMEIHAQIISTILKEQYIDRWDNFWTKLINILLCYLFTLFCWFATTRFKSGVAILIKLAQVAILLTAFFAGYYLFNCYNIDIAYSKAIIVMGVVILIVDIYHVGITLGKKWIFKLNKIDKK
jgi:CHASE2 domain-containing sensor protein